MVSSQEITAMIKRIKQEPPDEDMVLKQTNAELDRVKRKSGEDAPTPLKRARQYSESGKPTIPCLMCDRYLENQDELMIHMTLDHQCSPQGGRRQAGRIPKHACQICFAKFRTLRDLFTHTAIHAKQLQMKADLMSDIGNRVEKGFLKLGTTRQYFTNVQNSFQAEVQHGTFKCDCCNNIFMNRDTYAMHVMMRVKDEMCKQDELQNGLPKIKTVNGQYGDTVNLVSPQSGQDVLIEVTSNAHEDEYLKTALSITEHFQRTPKSESRQDPRRKCMYCNEHFNDQDSMAMHVMSVHAGPNIPKTTPQRGELKNSFVSPGQKNEREYNNVMAMKEYFRCHFCGNVFDSRDSLAMHVLSHSEDKESRTNTCNTEKTESLDNRSHANHLECNGELHSPNEPLNLVSEKNQKHASPEKINVSKSDQRVYETGTRAVNTKQQPPLIKVTDTRRCTRSASLPDVREQPLIAKRPASTGGIALSDDWKNNSKIAEYQANGTNSPAVTYNYEHPESLAEDREPSCQYVSSPQLDPLQLLLQKRDQAHVCAYCEIIFLNKTLFYLHMGLHNVNNPLQCNMCGKSCDNIHDFSAHVMHL